MEVDRSFHQVEKYEGENVKLAVTGMEYEFIPIDSLADFISFLQDFWNVRKPKGIAITYTYSPEILSSLAEIHEEFRVMAGRGGGGWVRGAYVSSSKTHFKGVMSWDNESTVFYLGSANLTYDVGNNYGLIVIKKGGFECFSLKDNLRNYREWMCPFEVIFTDAVMKETGGMCEVCNSPSEELWIRRGMFVCEDCLRR